MGILLAASLRVSVPLLTAWFVTRLMRARSASARHDVWAAALLSGMALLVLPVLLPSWTPALLPTDAFTNPALSARGGPAGALAGLWMIGAVASLGLLGASIARLTAWTASAAPLPASHDLSRLVADLGAPGSFELRVGPKVPVPYVWGVLRPAVVLPESLLTWSSADQRSALVHELAHLDRRDIVWRLLGEVFRAILWFHPLVWICLARMREESEAACDARVLADGRPRAEYAAQLLRLGARRPVADRLAPCLGQRQGLRARIERIVAHAGPAADTPAVAPATRQTAATLWAVATIALAVFSPGTNGVEREADRPLHMSLSIEREVTRERRVTVDLTVDLTVASTVGRTVTRNLNRTTDR